MTVAYYETLQDGDTRISTDTREEYREKDYPPSFRLVFDPPNDIVVDEHLLNRLILCYRVYTGANDTNVELIASVNDRDIRTRPKRLTSSILPQTFHEIVNWDCNIQRGKNEISFEVRTGGIGYVSISDVIIWYKRS